MLKKIGLSAIALAGSLLMAVPSPAAAKVRFGITVGTPGYVYPADPYAYNYRDPYNYGSAAPAYVAPGYVAPYYGYSYSWGDRDRDRHEWREHERHERQEHYDRQDHRDSRRR